MFKKATCIIGLILGIAIPVVLVLGGMIVKTSDLWPGFFVVLLYFIGRCTNLGELKEIVLGGLVGLFWNWWGFLLIGYLVPHVGFQAALAIGVGVPVFILAILGDISQVWFNNYGMIYYLTSAMFAEQSLDHTLTWMGTLLGAGLVFGILVFGSLKTFLKMPLSFK
jgi:hypothetical protein